jgi:erythromycin esterase-like protein
MTTLTATGILKLLPTRPRLLALGEPTHGEELLLDIRNEIFQHLVEHEGYRTIGLETDCLMGLVVDDYVTTGTGTLDHAMEHGFSHGWGASAGNRDLVRWMRAHNDGRPATEQVRFAGLDGPLEMTHVASPRQALTALHGYLATRLDADLLPCTTETLDHLLGTDDRWTSPAVIMDPSQSIGQTTEAKQLRLLADDLATLLDTQTQHLITDGWHRARLYARTATGLLRYHHWMADPSPARLTRLVNARASMITANLLAAVAHGPTLAHAHNLHFQPQKSRMRMGDLPLEWWSSGATVSAHLGDNYAFLAGAVGTIRHHGVDTPPTDTIEGHLYALPEDRYLADPAEFASANLSPRESPWFGYFPLAPAHLADLDGIVFVKDL